MINLQNTNLKKVSAEELASPEIPANSSPVIEEIFPDPELERDVFVESTHADNQDIFELLRGMNQNPNLGSATLHEQRPEVPETFVIKLIKSKLPIVFIAIIVYLLFAKDAEYLVGSSVFTVLLGWEVLEFVLMGEAAYRGASARANYLGILFVLGGVPQKTSAIVIRALDILNKVLRDVAIFIFIFVLTHLAWSYFVIKDSLSVILDKDFNVQIQENHEEL